MRLWNLAPLIPEERRFTRRFHGRRELIDHILVSQKLTDPRPHVGVRHQSGGSVGLDPLARRDVPASDHDPVFATLTL